MRHPLGAVLTVTTGKLLCPIEDLYKLLDFMTGDQLMTHQLPRAADECEVPLSEQFPQLKDVVVPPIKGEADCRTWLSQQADFFGEQLDVQPLNPLDHTQIHPLVELRQMTDAPIIVMNGDDL